MIKRIRIAGFKSIRDQTVELEPVTVLVGRSGTGKSAFVQAIRFFRNLLFTSIGDAVQREGGGAVIVPAGEKQAKTSFEFVFQLPDDGSDYHYSLDLEWNGVQGAGVTNERLSYAQEPVLARSWNANAQWKWDFIPAVVPEPSPNASEPLLRQFPGLSQTVYPYTVLSTGIGFYYFPSSVLAQNTAANDPLMPGLRDSAGNYLDAYKAIVQNFQNPQIQKRILASLRCLNESVESLDLDSLLNPTRLVIGHRLPRGVLTLPLSQESDGFRRFLAHLLAICQSPAKFLNIFEEPENAIYPGALSLLADEFKAAPDNERGQVILTTHSPELLNGFDVQSLRVVEMIDGETQIGPVAEEQQNVVRDRLLTTGELLTVETPRRAGAQPPAEAVHP